MLLLSEAAGAEKIAPIPNPIYDALTEAEKDRTIITWRNLPGTIRAYLLRCEHTAAVRLLRREADNFDDDANINRLPNRKFARRLYLNKHDQGWVIVDDEKATTGILALDVAGCPGANEGAHVRFEIQPQGFADALGWLGLEACDASLPRDHSCADCGDILSVRSGYGSCRYSDTAMGYCW